MDLSPDILEPFKTDEYKKHLKYKKWFVDNEFWLWFLISIVHLSWYISTIKIYTGTWNHPVGYYIVTLIISVYPGFFVTVILLGILIVISTPFSLIFNKLSIVQRYKSLKKGFQTAEDIANNQIKDFIDNHLKLSLKELKLKQEDLHHYKILLSKFWLNKHIVDEASTLFLSRDLQRNFYNQLKSQNMQIKDGLLIIGEEPKPTPKYQPTYKYRTTNKKPTTAKKSNNSTGIDWNFIKSGSSQEKSEPAEKSEPSKSNTPTTKTSAGAAKAPKAKPTNSGKTAVKSEKPVAKNTQGQLFVEDELPDKRSSASVPRNPIIKASPEFWLQMAEKKMSIGRKGELLAMSYEKDRILKEEGERFLPRLVHLSEEEGDGFGYDIKSVKDSEEIYIEVKTTTGGFWSGLYFSVNELKTMGKLGDNYFLFRIYNFNELENTGKLLVFEGADEINSEFEFSPHSYVLQPKN